MLRIGHVVAQDSFPGTRARSHDASLHAIRALRHEYEVFADLPGLETVTEFPERETRNETTRLISNTSESESTEDRGPLLPYEFGYESGFFLRPVDPDKHPFSIRASGRLQFRYTGFAREINSWTDNAGVTRPVVSRNDFEIERLRLVLQGFFIDPKWGYFVQLEGDTDNNHRETVLDFWVNYQVSDQLVLHVGKAFIPGSRDWLNGDRLPRFADRSMATEFFRPDRAVGVWALGDLADNLHYRAMIANTFRGPNLRYDEIDKRFTYSGSLWWDPLGDYGLPYSDLEWKESPVVRLGTSLAYASERGRTGTGAPFTEQDYLRLSDGTRLDDIGALAPGVRVNGFDVLLYAIDFAGKYRGFSWNGEYFLRWTNALRGTGPLPIDGLFDHGFYAEVGHFVSPQRLELIGRTSQIYGTFGSAFEYAGGFNWFINGTHNLKLTFDVSRVIGTPVESTLGNYQVGSSGVMFRTQLQAAF